MYAVDRYQYSQVQNQAAELRVGCSIEKMNQ